MMIEITDDRNTDIVQGLFECDNNKEVRSTNIGQDMILRFRYEISILISPTPLTRISFLQKTGATATPTRRESALRLRPPPRSRCRRCGAWTAATASWWSGAPTAGSRSGRQGRARSSEKSCCVMFHWNR